MPEVPPLDLQQEVVEKEERPVSVLEDMEAQLDALISPGAQSVSVIEEANELEEVTDRTE